jgi:hypothetical protein
MEELFNKFKELLIIYNNYSGIVCGYNNEHFILAIKSSNLSYGFGKLPKESIILEKYISSKYKYVYEDEWKLNKQLNETLTIIKKD